MMFLLCVAWIGYGCALDISSGMIPFFMLVYFLMFTCFCTEPCCFWSEMSLRSDNESTCCFWSDNYGDKRGLFLFTVSFGVLSSYFEGDLRELSCFAYFEEYVEAESILLPLTLGVTTIAFLLELMIVFDDMSDYSVKESVSKAFFLFFCCWYDIYQIEWV